MTNLREALIGAWKLVSYVETNTETGETNHPMGPDPQGIILYTPDGYMSAQLCPQGRPEFAGGDMFLGTVDDYVAEGTSYIAYTGPFHIDASGTVLTHEMFVSLFPNWVGQAQVRLANIEGDKLHLSTNTPMPFGGASKTASLMWTRAAVNG
jgi:hypothetical protein